MMYSNPACRFSTELLLKNFSLKFAIQCMMASSWSVALRLGCATRALNSNGANASSSNGDPDDELELSPSLLFRFTFRMINPVSFRNTISCSLRYPKHMRFLRTHCVHDGRAKSHLHRWGGG